MNKGGGQWIALLLAIIGAPLAAQSPALIPAPQSVSFHPAGFPLPDTVDVTLSPASPRLHEIAALLTEDLAHRGITVRTSNGPTARRGITLAIRDPRAGDESYHLRSSRDGVSIEAPAEAGILWGVQTLRQLVEKNGTRWQVSGVEIQDAPRYPWRGAMLDVSRHLFPIEYILSHLDWMSRNKLNRFHWHLTDDQGWRIAIDAYPRLTTVGAFRTEADGRVYGGWYTKDEVRRVVERARVLGIEVIPEIELPGHSRAALAAYPELGCTGDTLAVPTTWGVFSDVLCPGKEATFTFLEAVLSEVLELFPSHYIHIGGDEVPKQRWVACSSCQEIIRREGLGDEHGLQRWMVARIGQWLAARGRTLIGWDEILDGGLPPGATVQAWQGSDRITKALEAGADVIASPSEWIYLNRPANELPLNRVIRFDPSTAVTAKARGRLLGGEAPLWTEHVTSPANAELMWWPRLLGFAETMWKGPADAAEFDPRAARVATAMRAAGVAVGPADHGLVSLRFRYDSNTKEIRVAHDAATTGLHLMIKRNAEPAKEILDGAPLPDVGEWLVSAEWQGEMVGEPRMVSIVSHRAVGKSIQLATPTDSRYPGTGEQTLVDGARGSSFNDGFWNGWQGPDLDATLDLGERTTVASVTLSLLEQVNSWILFPEVLELYQSEDGRTWRRVVRSETPRPVVPDAASRELVTLTPSAPISTRWIRVVARGGRRLPEEHAGHGQLAWIFADEIIVR